MKILIFNFEYPPLGGGGGVATAQIAEELASRHEVHVITSRHGSLSAGEKLNGVHVHRVRVMGRRDLPTATLLSMVSFVPGALVKGWRLSGQIFFDVINAQFVIPSGLPARLLAGVRRVPFVLSFIGGDVFDPTKGVSPHRHPLLRLLIRWIARGAMSCTAISEDTARRAMELHGVRQNIVVTHLGIVPREVLSADRQHLGLPEGPLFVSVGRLIPRKGYKVLFKAWETVPDAHLAILGDGPLRGELIGQAREARIEGRVHMLGYVDEERKLQILRVADGYVSATEHEGFGIVFLEGMDAGLPIVATNEGGHTDFLQDGVNALLVEKGDAKQLAAGVRRLLGNQKLRERMAANNKLAVKEFYLAKTAAKFEAVLVKAVNV